MPILVLILYFQPRSLVPASLHCILSLSLSPSATHFSEAIYNIFIQQPRPAIPEQSTRCPQFFFFFLTPFSVTLPALQSPDMAAHLLTCISFACKPCRYLTGPFPLVLNKFVPSCYVSFLALCFYFLSSCNLNLNYNLDLHLPTWLPPCTSMYAFCNNKYLESTCCLLFLNLSPVLAAQPWHAPPSCTKGLTFVIL